MPGYHYRPSKQSEKTRVRTVAIAPRSLKVLQCLFLSTRSTLHPEDATRSLRCLLPLNVHCGLKRDASTEVRTNKQDRQMLSAKAFPTFIMLKASPKHHPIKIQSSPLPPARSVPLFIE